MVWHGNVQLDQPPKCPLLAHKRATLRFPVPRRPRAERHANRDQVPAPSPTRALGPRDRRLECMLAGWLGQRPGVLHRDGNEEINGYKEKGENRPASR